MAEAQGTRFGKKWRAENKMAGERQNGGKNKMAGNVKK
jgi:hypothetical protein